MTFRLLSLAAACLLLMAGCRKPNSVVLGNAPTGKPQTISSVKTEKVQTPVTLQGVMIEKCPVAGCWFRLRDRTGEIKVDTKLAGFVVLDVPLESRLTVAGKKALSESGEITIEATGVRY